MAKERQPTAETLGGNVQTRIFFNDDLTRKNSEIKFEAKRLWNGYFVWSRRGKIYAREKSEDGKPTTIHQINSKEDVNTLKREWMARENKAKNATPGGTKRSVDERSPTEDNCTQRKKWQSELEKFKNRK